MTQARRERAAKPKGTCSKLVGASNRAHRKTPTLGLAVETSGGGCPTNERRDTQVGTTDEWNIHKLTNEHYSSYIRRMITEHIHCRRMSDETSKSRWTIIVRFGNRWMKRGASSPRPNTRLVSLGWLAGCLAALAPSLCLHCGQGCGSGSGSSVALTKSDSLPCHPRRAEPSPVESIPPSFPVSS